MWPRSSSGLAVTLSHLTVECRGRRQRPFIIETLYFLPITILTILNFEPYSRVKTKAKQNIHKELTTGIFFLQEVWTKVGLRLGLQDTEQSFKGWAK